MPEAQNKTPSKANPSDDKAGMARRLVGKLTRASEGKDGKPAWSLAYTQARQAMEQGQFDVVWRMVAEGIPLPVDEEGPDGLTLLEVAFAVAPSLPKNLLDSLGSEKGSTLSENADSSNQNPWSWLVSGDYEESARQWLDEAQKFDTESNNARDDRRNTHARMAALARATIALLIHQGSRPWRPSASKNSPSPSSSWEREQSVEENTKKYGFASLTFLVDDSNGVAWDAWSACLALGNEDLVWLMLHLPGAPSAAVLEELPAGTCCFRNMEKFDSLRTVTAECKPEGKWRDVRDTCLHQAVEGKDLNIVRLLLNHGMDPNRENALGFRPMELAGSASMIRLLLSKGATWPSSPAARIKESTGKDPSLLDYKEGFRASRLGEVANTSIPNTPPDGAEVARFCLERCDAATTKTMLRTVFSHFERKLSPERFHAMASQALFWTAEHGTVASFDAMVKIMPEKDVWSLVADRGEKGKWTLATALLLRPLSPSFEQTASAEVAHLLRLAKESEVIHLSHEVMPGITNRDLAYMRYLNPDKLSPNPENDARIFENTARAAMLCQQKKMGHDAGLRWLLWTLITVPLGSEKSSTGASLVKFTWEWFRCQYAKSVQPENHGAEQPSQIEAAKFFRSTRKEVLANIMPNFLDSEGKAANPSPGAFPVYTAKGNLGPIWLPSQRSASGNTSVDFRMRQTWGKIAENMNGFSGAVQPKEKQKSSTANTGKEKGCSWSQVPTWRALANLHADNHSTARKTWQDAIRKVLTDELPRAGVFFKNVVDKDGITPCLNLFVKRNNLGIGHKALYAIAKNKEASFWSDVAALWGPWSMVDASEVITDDGALKDDWSVRTAAIWRLSMDLAQRDGHEWTEKTRRLCEKYIDAMEKSIDNKEKRGMFDKDDDTRSIIKHIKDCILGKAEMMEIRKKGEDVFHTSTSNTKVGQGEVSQEHQNKRRSRMKI